MEIQTNGYTYVVDLIERETVAELTERAWFIASQRPHNDAEYAAADLLSRQWFYWRHRGCRYDAAVEKRLAEAEHQGFGSVRPASQSASTASTRQRQPNGRPLNRAPCPKPSGERPSTQGPRQIRAQPPAARMPPVSGKQVSRAIS